MKTKRIADARIEYQQHNLARGLSQSTVRCQGDSLNLFERVVGNLWLREIGAQHVDQVFSSYAWGPSTRNNRIGQYRAFFRWAKARSYTDQDPLFGWRALRVPDQPRERIPMAEWPRVFAACLHPQEEIVIATGFYLFLRVSEMQVLQLQHVHLSDSLIDVWRPKTKQWDSMPISCELDPYLRRWMTYLAGLGYTDPENYLIGTRKRDLDITAGLGAVAGTGTVDATRPLTQPSRTVRRVLERSGYYVKQEGGHTLRRSGARAYFDELVGNGYDGALRRVQSMLGHSHSIMTERYLGLDLDRQRRNQDLRGRPMFSEQVGVRYLRGVSNQAL